VFNTDPAFPSHRGGHGEDRKGIIRGKLNRGRKGKEEGHNPSMVKFCIHLTTLK